MSNDKILQVAQRIFHTYIHTACTCTWTLYWWSNYGNDLWQVTQGGLLMQVLPWKIMSYFMSLF